MFRFVYRAIFRIIFRVVYMYNSLRLLLPLIFTSWCLLCQPTYVDSIFHCTSFSSGKCPDGIFAMFIRDASKFSGKNSSGNAKNEVSMACYTALHRMMKFLLHSFTLIIRLFAAYEVSADIFRCFPGSYLCRIRFCTEDVVFEQLFNLRINENSFFHLGLTF